VFGFSFGELVVLVIVGVVVIGPKDMPKVLRKLGQWSGKIRRMASDIRTQSGIDEVLRGEGISEDIAEIRKLARGEMENVTRATRITAAASPVISSDPYVRSNDEVVVQRDREYPREGADSYKALPDTALIYASSLPPSALARDPLYRTGDPDGVLPPEAPVPSPVEAAPAEAPAEAAPAEAVPAAEPHHPGHDA
jgi:sec-independent protein translocase protein TatB